MAGAEAEAEAAGGGSTTTTLWRAHAEEEERGHGVLMTALDALQKADNPSDLALALYDVIWLTTTPQDSTGSNGAGHGAMQPPRLLSWRERATLLECLAREEELESMGLGRDHVLVQAAWHRCSCWYVPGVSQLDPPLPPLALLFPDTFGGEDDEEHHVDAQADHDEDGDGEEKGFEAEAEVDDSSSSPHNDGGEGHNVNQIPFLVKPVLPNSRLLCYLRRKRHRLLKGKAEEYELIFQEHQSLDELHNSSPHVAVSAGRSRRQQQDGTHPRSEERFLMGAKRVRSNKVLFWTSESGKHWKDKDAFAKLCPLPTAQSHAGGALYQASVFGEGEGDHCHRPSTTSILQTVEEAGSEVSAAATSALSQVDDPSASSATTATASPQQQQQHQHQQQQQPAAPSSNVPVVGSSIVMQAGAAGRHRLINVTAVLPRPAGSSSAASSHGSGGNSSDHTRDSMRDRLHEALKRIVMHAEPVQQPHRRGRSFVKSVSSESTDSTQRHQHQHGGGGSAATDNTHTVPIASTPVASSSASSIVSGSSTDPVGGAGTVSGTGDADGRNRPHTAEDLIPLDVFALRNVPARLTGDKQGVYTLDFDLDRVRAPSRKNVMIEPLVVCYEGPQGRERMVLRPSSATRVQQANASDASHGPQSRRYVASRDVWAPQESDPNARILQMGKLQEDVFSVDIQWPLSPFQAFAIVLACFSQT